MYDEVSSIFNGNMGKLVNVIINDIAQVSFTFSFRFLLELRNLDVKVMLIFYPLLFVFFFFFILLQCKLWMSVLEYSCSL